MEQTFLNEINIKKVRHLQDISIPLSKKTRKHLILTGKNGSGKTSVIEALAKNLGYIVSDGFYTEKELIKNVEYWKDKTIKECKTEEDFSERERAKKTLEMYEEKLENWTEGVATNCNSYYDLRKKYKQGSFILAYYKDERRFQVESYQNIEKIELEHNYHIHDNPGKKFAKYLVDLKATQAFSKDSRKVEKIEKWFIKLENILKRVFEDPELRLEFNEESFQFTIHESGHEPFDFNSMSRGYAAVFDIINDLIIRMEANTKLMGSFDLEGIVLIDEIETHLHLELQKKIMPILTELFPNLQFVISTHSPFVLNSLEDVVVYDLEKEILVADGMGSLPYEGIVEGYFGVDRLSDELRKKFERYKEIVRKEKLTDEEYAEVDELEYYLDEIPDYLASEITTEYSRLRLEFENRR